MIRALLIDLDGVVREWDPENDRQAEQATGLPMGAIRRAAFSPDLLHVAITGRISDDCWRRRVVDRLRAEFPHADAEQAVRRWSVSSGAVNRDVLNLVRACRARAQVVLVTNATSRLSGDLRRLGLLDEIDHVVNSATVGFIKPHRGVFDHALGLVGASAGEALFVDDTAEHVAAASRLGIAGHVFRGPEHLRAELARHGLLP